MTRCLICPQDTQNFLKYGGNGLKKCSMCGKEFDEWDEQENFCFEHNVGYGSKYDMCKIDLKLCCDCFDKVMDYIVSQCRDNPVSEVQ